MLIRTHLSITIFALLLVLQFYDFSSEISLVVFIIVAIFSSMLPDIDTPRSRIGKYVFLRPLQYFAGHRKGFHSLIFVLVFGLLIGIFSKLIAWAFVLGYGLHIIADSFTITGINLFYPYPRVFRGWIKSGGRSDLMIFIIFIILNGIFILKYFLN